MTIVIDVYDYLRHLGLNVWIKLYRGNDTFLAIFRSFTELEQLVVFRLLFLSQPVSERALRLWFKPGNANELNTTLYRLVSCHALTLIPTQNPTSTGGKSTTINQYKLQDDFREGLLRCVLGKEYNQNVEESPPLKLNIQDLNHDLYAGLNKSFLFDYSRHRWELILRYIVSIEFRKKVAKSAQRIGQANPDLQGKPAIIAEDVITTLKRHKLVFKPSKSTVSQTFQTVGMSRQALSWLLRDIRYQLNSLVLEFIYLYDMGKLTNVKLSDEDNDESQSQQPQTLSDAEKDVTDIISFILTISQLTIGQPITSKGLTKTQKRFLRFAVDLGILWQPKFDTDNYIDLDSGIHGIRRDKIYFAAPHALMFRSHISEPSSLVSVTSTADFTSKNLDFPKHYFSSYLLNKTETNIPRMRHNLESGIIVQSNFKVYVYTASPLQINVLAHLCELQSRTPNLVIGVLTRNSAHAAFRAGITAKQICQFLETHSHPSLLQNVREGGSYLPLNVVTQLNMWEAERNRISLEPCVLIKKWDPEYLPESFQHAVRWAETKNYLLHYTQWPDDPTSQEFQDWLIREKYLACKSSCQDELIEFIKSLKDLKSKLNN